MPKLKVLSGEKVRSTLEYFGFELSREKGSHWKFKRTSRNGEEQTLTIPNHKELDRGTLKAIYNQASRYISADDLYFHFYTTEK